MVAYKEYGYTSFPQLMKFMETTIGYLEKASISNLGDFTSAGKTVNAGFNNYTIYWEWYKTITGRSWQKEPYCAGYLSVMLAAAFGVEKAKKLLCGELNISVQSGYNNFNRKGQIHSTPKVGDVVFFWSAKLNRYGHTALVVGVDSNENGYTTIEANTSSGSEVERNGGATCRKHYTGIGTRKEKFGRPDYAAVGISMNDTATDSATPSPSVPEMVTYAIGTGANGLCVTAEKLNCRSIPATGEVCHIFNKDDKIVPTLKTFVNGDPWVYDPNFGWVSAKYLYGWIQEFTCDNKWWYVEVGYTFPTNTIKVIDGNPYYFDYTGYMFTGTLTITTDENGVLKSSSVPEAGGDV